MHVGENFDRPARFPGEWFETHEGAEDPAQVLRVARDTAHALVGRARSSDDPALVDRIAAYTDEQGIDAIAELWARSSAKSLAGALWRVYLLRLLVRENPQETSLLFQRGTEVLTTIDPTVAGAGDPAGPHELAELADRILHGVFRGDLAGALERAAAFCRVTAAGALSIADDAEPVNPDRATELTNRASRLTHTASDLTACARLWRQGSLD